MTGAPLESVYPHWGKRMVPDDLLGYRYPSEFHQEETQPLIEEPSRKEEPLPPYEEPSPGVLTRLRRAMCCG